MFLDGADAVSSHRILFLILQQFGCELYVRQPDGAVAVPWVIPGTYTVLSFTGINPETDFISKSI